MARPRKCIHDDHEPTDETRKLVCDLYSAGITKMRIAAHIKIDINTLNKYYTAELEDSLEAMVATLSNGVYQDALDGDKQQRELFLKCRGKWSPYKPPEEQPAVQIVTALDQLTETIKAQNESNK